MGLPDGHPEKEGVEVDLASLVAELRKRLDAKQSSATLSEQLQGTVI